MMQVPSFLSVSVATVSVRFMESLQSVLLTVQVEFIELLLMHIAALQISRFSGILHF